MAIRSFRSKSTELFFKQGQIPKRAGWQAQARVAARKLDLIHYADRLDDLASPPGNRLEALHGKLAGFHSIRVNDQWRVVFIWNDRGATDVDIVDYH